MKESLNGHYCLATQEQRKKLKEDGIHISSEDGIYDVEHLEIIDNIALVTTLEVNCLGTPMHLRNNEWVFGSLEHEEVPVIEEYKEITNEEIDRFVNNEPKQVQRTARSKPKGQIMNYEEEIDKFVNDTFPKDTDARKHLYTSLILYGIIYQLDKQLTKEEATELNASMYGRADKLKDR